MGLDIACPIHGRIDATQAADIVCHPVMQRLNRVQQLGGVYAVFPGGKHTRFAHCLGAYWIMRQRTSWLQGQGLISPELALAGSVAALVHDAGHRPFSHMVESLIGDHDERLLYLIRHDLAEVISSLGVNLDLLGEIVSRRHPLAGLVFHTPLGADKLDYLARDAYHTVGTRHGFQDFTTLYIGWRPDDGLFLVNRGLASYLNLLNTYWYQYTDLYDRPSGRAAERYLQELIRGAIAEEPSMRRNLEEGGEDELLGAIAAWCYAHPGHAQTERYNRIAARRHPRKALIFSERPLLTSTREGSGHVAEACDAAFIKQSLAWTPEDLTRLEAGIATALGVPAWEVSVSPPPAARRWQVPDLKVEVSNGTLKPIQEILPELAQSAEAYARIALSTVVSLDDATRLRVAADPGAQRAVRAVLQGV